MVNIQKYGIIYIKKIKSKESKNIISFNEFDKIILDIHKYGKYLKQLQHLVIGHHVSV